MSAAPETRGPWLAFSWPIAALGIAASATGLLWDRVYEDETENWAAQAVAQDAANIPAFLALAAFAALASRGSLAAYLAWLGVVAYAAYSYAIYAFAIHFGPLFLVYVAVLGLSTYALAGGAAELGAARVQAAAGPRAPIRPVAWLAIGLGAAFALLWLAETLRAAAAGTEPDALAETGLVTNPVHVLDLALFLPALILGGVLLARRRPLGYVLAPVTLFAAFWLSIAIVAIAVHDGTWGLAAGIAVVALAELAVVARFLASLR